MHTVARMLMRKVTSPMRKEPGFSSHDDPWYVVQCKPRMEFLVAHTLHNHADLFVFLPECKQESCRKDRKNAPLFPGYLFVQVNLQKVPVNIINRSPGVVRLVAFDGEPEPIASSLVALIYERVQQMHMVAHAPTHFRVGDTVKVKKGSLQSLDMIFLGSATSNERVNVLLSILGRQKKVQIEADALEKVSPVSA